MRVTVESCHSIGATGGVRGVVVTGVGRRGRRGSFGDAGKLNGPADHTADRCLMTKQKKYE